MALIDGDDYKITSVDKDVSLPKKVETIDYKIDDFDRASLITSCIKKFTSKLIQYQIQLMVE
jgi:hypothetical protein